MFFSSFWHKKEPLGFRLLSKINESEILKLNIQDGAQKWEDTNLILSMLKVSIDTPINFESYKK